MADIIEPKRGNPFTLYETYDQNDGFSEYKIRDSVFYNRIPTRLKRTFCFSILLVLVGLCLLVFGIIKANESDNIQDAFALWILSFLCLLPGAYYLCQFIRAKSELNEDFRREILDEIPTL